MQPNYLPKQSQTSLEDSNPFAISVLPSRDRSMTTTPPNKSTPQPVENRDTTLNNSHNDALPTTAPQLIPRVGIFAFDDEQLDSVNIKLVGLTGHIATIEAPIHALDEELTTLRAEQKQSRNQDANNEASPNHPRDHAQYKPVPPVTNHEAKAPDLGIEDLSNSPVTWKNWEHYVDENEW